MEHLQQPPKTMLCGQYCLAMILNRPVKEIIEQIGHSHGTTIAEIRNFIIKNGMGCSDRIIYKNEKYLAPTAMLVLRWKKGSHWMIYNNGVIYDPACEVLYHITHKLWNHKGGYIESHINIW